MTDKELATLQKIYTSMPQEIKNIAASIYGNPDMESFLEKKEKQSVYDQRQRTNIARSIALAYNTYMSSLVDKSTIANDFMHQLLTKYIV